MTTFALGRTFGLRTDFGTQIWLRVTDTVRPRCAFLVPRLIAGAAFLFLIAIVVGVV